MLQYSTSRLLHSIAVTLHYIYLRYFNRLVHHITIQYIALQYVTVQSVIHITLQYIMWQYSISHYLHSIAVTPHYITYVTLIV